jgi:hypothetical protein
MSIDKSESFKKKITKSFCFTKHSADLQLGKTLYDIGTDYGTGRQYLYIYAMDSKKKGSGYGKAMFRECVEKSIQGGCDGNIQLEAVGSSHIFHLLMGMVPIESDLYNNWMRYILYIDTMYGKRSVMTIEKWRTFDPENAALLFYDKMARECLERIICGEILGIKSKPLTDNEILMYRDDVLNLQNVAYTTLACTFVPIFLDILKTGKVKKYPDTKRLDSVWMKLSQPGLERWKEAIKEGISFEYFDDFRQLHPYLTSYQRRILDGIVEERRWHQKLEKEQDIFQSSRKNRSGAHRFFNDVENYQRVDSVDEELSQLVELKYA